MRPDQLGAVQALDGLSRATRRLLPLDLTRPDRVCLVATARPDVIGYAGAAVAQGDLHVLDLAVRTSWRRRGIGCRLLADLLSRARDEHGAGAATLEVRAANHAARALYRRLGFQAVGRRPGYYDPHQPGSGREDAIVMWRHDLDGLAVPSGPR